MTLSQAVCGFSSVFTLAIVDFQRLASSQVDVSSKYIQTCDNFPSVLKSRLDHIMWYKTSSFKSNRYILIVFLFTCYVVMYLTAFVVKLLKLNSQPNMLPAVFSQTTNHIVTDC